MIRRTRASVVCLRGDTLLCVRLRDPVSGVERLFPPGGEVEPGETAAAAAERETLEETGYRVVVDEASERVASYPFTWAGRAIDCTTHFFRARLRDEAALPAPVHDDAINRGVVWLDCSRLQADLGFDSSILDAVQALLGETASPPR